MNNLPILRQPFNMLPPARMPADESVSGIKSILRELEAILLRLCERPGAAGISADPELLRTIKALNSVLTDTEAVPPPGPVIPARDHINVGGPVMSGANVGGGTTINNGGVAGRNHVTATTYIDSAQHVHIGGQDRVSVQELEHIYLKRLLTLANRVSIGQLALQLATTEKNMPEMRLDELYVPLDSTRTQAAVGGEDDTEPWTNVPVLDPIIRNRRVVILGDPGSGKSTLINFLAMALAGARLHPEGHYLEYLNVPRQGKQRAVRWRYGALLPIRVELRELVRDIPAGTQRGTAKLVWDHLIAQLAAADLERLADHLKDLLHRGQCLVMFDGLDEIPAPAQRRVVQEAVTAFADTYDESRYIVTCRVLSYADPERQLSSFPAITLAPLNQEAAHRFIDNWYATLASGGQFTREQANRRAEELWHGIEMLDDLASNPMLLTVIAMVHTYKGALPYQRARLYDDCVNLLLWDWQMAKHNTSGIWEPGILQELDTREERLINGLCEVAFEAQRSQAGQTSAAQILEADVLRILQRYLDGKWSRAEKFCDYVEKRSGLLVGKGENEKGDRVYAFAHRGFQEFLAARHLVSGWEFSRRVADLVAEGDLWHEVVRLAVGHLVFNQQEITRPLDAINLLTCKGTPTDEVGWRAVWWAGEMLHMVGVSAAEQDEYLGKQLVSRVLKQLTALVQGGHLSPRERALAADVLGLLGDPRPGVTRFNVKRDMVLFSGGTAEIGPEGGSCKVHLRPFYLSRYPVTNAQFRYFIKSGYRVDKYWTARGLRWRDRSPQRYGFTADPRWGIDNRPVVGVTWHEAVAYVRWLADKTGLPFRLPTEAEWEFAAAGQERRRYPWGERAHANMSNIRDTGLGQTTAVGIFPSDRTPEGLYDMGGNVWEWTSSLAKGYPYRPADGREDLEASGARMLRGGSYDSPRQAARCTERLPVEPHARVPMIGFRIALNPD